MVSENLLEDIKNQISRVSSKKDMLRINNTIEKYYNEGKIAQIDMKELRRLMLNKKNDKKNDVRASVLIKNHRVEKKISKKELSILCDASVTIITKLETDRPGYIPTFEKLMSIAEILDIDKDELYKAIRLNHEWVCYFWDDMNKGQYYMPIGEMIRFLREKDGYSLTEVSLETNISQPYITILEQGKRTTTLDKLNIFLKKYKLTEDEFFEQLYIEDRLRKKFGEKFDLKGE